MEESDMIDLYRVLDQIDKETEDAIKSLNTMRDKGKKLVQRAEAVQTPSLRPKVKELTKSALTKVRESLSDIIAELELCHIGFPNTSISYPPVGEDTIEVKFLTGDSPWNFWLQNEKIDCKKLQKNLLKKHQNDLLEPYMYPKISDSVCFLDRNKVFRGIVLQLNSNSVKVLDCDSNLTRVVARNCLFTMDLDACHPQASAFRCTINKDSDGSESWDNYLRDIFCNCLKESRLQVKIVEKLPDSLPTFLVDVRLQNDDGESANLKEWIFNRLLLEVKSLSKVGEVDHEFLSAEALDPFCEASLGDTKILHGKNVKPDVNMLDKSDDEKVNNLNYNFKKVTVKCVPNVEIKEDLPSSLSGSRISSSEEISSSCSSSTDNIKSNITSSTSDSCKVEVNSSLSSKPIALAQEVPAAQPKHVPPQPVFNPNFYQPLPNTAAYPPVLYHSVHPMQLMYRHPEYHRPPPPAYPPLNWNQPPLPAPWSQNINPLLQVCQNVSTDKHTSSSNNKNAKLNVLSQEFVPVTGNNLNPMGQEFVPMNGVVQHKKNQTSQNASEHSYSSDNLALPTKVVEEPVYFKVKTNYTILKPGDNMIVVISHVESPGEFYINFLSQSNTYSDKLLEDMFNYYNLKEKVTFNTCEAAEKALGKFCACKWQEDNHWYRAETRHWDYKNNRVKVFFLDHGNSEYVSPSALQPLTKDFCKLSQMAQLCYLNKTSFYKDREWSEESLAIFKETVLPSGVFNATVIPGTSKNKPVDNSLSVRLYKGRTPDEAQCINNMLVECAKEWSPRTSHQPEDINSRVAGRSERLVPLSPPPDASQIPVLPNEGKKTDNAKSINEILVECAKKLKCPVPKSTEHFNIAERLLSPPPPPPPPDAQIFESKKTDNAKSFNDFLVDCTKKQNCQVSQATEDFNIREPPQIPADMENQEEWEAWDPQAEDYNSVRNNPELDTDDAGVALVGYKAQDEARICRFYAQYGNCWKSYCTQEHIRPNPDGVTTDKQEVYNSCISEIQMPSIGEEIKVKITCVESINQFYVQLEEQRAVSMDSDDEDVETMTSLHSFINRPDNVHCMKKLILMPALGELVLARLDGVWYRGRVFSTGENEDPEVMLVDYGNIISIPEKDLRAMEPRYLHLPFQAIYCTLANIVPLELEKEVLEEATELLRQLIESRVLIAKIYDNCIVNELEVVLKSDAGRDLGDFIVSKGLATPVRLDWEQVAVNNICYSE